MSATLSAWLHLLDARASVGLLALVGWFGLVVWLLVKATARRRAARREWRRRVDVLQQRDHLPTALRRRLPSDGSDAG